MDLLAALSVMGDIRKNGAVYQSPQGNSNTNKQKGGGKNKKKQAQIPINQDPSKEDGEGSDSDAGDLSSNMTPVPSLTELNNLIDTYKNFKLLSNMAPPSLKTDTDNKEDVEDKFIHFPTSNGG